MCLLPCLTSVQAKENTKSSFKFELMFIYSINASKPHSCGDKDLRNKFTVVVSRRDNVKTKDNSQTFISEDLNWDIVLFHNRYILSQ